MTDIGGMPKILAVRTLVLDKLNKPFELRHHVKVKILMDGHLKSKTGRMGCDQLSVIWSSVLLHWPRLGFEAGRAPHR